MKYFSQLTRGTITLLLFTSLVLAGDNMTADQILEKVDANAKAKTKSFVCTMKLDRPEGDRELVCQVWIDGPRKAAIKFLAPPRESGKKVLKIDGKLELPPRGSLKLLEVGADLWQPIVGSDLSYSDLMGDKPYMNYYFAKMSGSDVVNGHQCWVLDLEARTTDVEYGSLKLWIDKMHFLPLKELRYGRDDKLIKTVEVFEDKRVKGHWVVKRARITDRRIQGEGTEIFIESMTFNEPIPSHVFPGEALVK